MRLPKQMNLETPGGRMEFYQRLYDVLVALENPNALRLGGNTIRYGTAAPGSGTFVAGDIVLDSTPSASGKIGWVCVTGGSPGTWKLFGPIDA